MRSIAMLAAASCLLLAQPAGAASTFDGVYTGATSAAGNGNARCPDTRPDFRITVRDGQLNYGGGGDRVPVTVGADGSFSAQSGQRYLQGKISGGRLSATTSGGRCNYVWDLQKS